MLHTRLWMGALLVLAGFAILIVDEWFEPWYPGFLVMVLGLGWITCSELVHLLRQNQIISWWLCLLGVAAVLSANWPAHFPRGGFLEWDVWLWIQTTFVGYLLVVFLVELANYRQPGGVIVRMSLSVWLVAYLGVLPSFLVQLRWLPVENHQGTTALIMAIFVPKCCDMGAYFTGRWLGRHRMTPVLSPKKTWEGALGGLTVAVIVTVVIDQLGPAALLEKNWWAEIGFGVSVGGAGIFGDLAESMIKRDGHQKDASHVVPGFGGVLDVIDAVLFAAPIAYLWLMYF